MKYLKYLLFAILLTAIIFIGKGLLTPAITYDCLVIVNKPIEEAWSVMSDETKVSGWLKSIKKIEPISGTPYTVGAISKIYIVEDGEEMVMEETITAITPNKHIAMTYTMDFMNMDYELFMNETNGKTNITSKSITKGNGIFAKSLLSFIVNSMKEQEDENLNNLKTVIEANTKVYTESNTTANQE